MDTKSQQRSETGSGLPPDAGDMPVLAEALQNGSAKPNVFGSGSTAFSTYYTWRANGVHKQVRFVNANVNSNSRVLVNISEFSGNPQNRFVGSARMAVYNIAPYQGGFLAWVDITWDNPLTVRFDVVVDP
jgi:hypothetical protein